uniref:Zona pellucida protein AX 1 n=1 Tax=Hippocampus comes TaxID=109280 RepID=A0A3Q2XLB2_HIPCM
MCKYIWFLFPHCAVSFPAGGLKADCVGNLMRLSLDKALAVGNQLEVEAINGTQHIALTPVLAAQCGYSMESDPWGNTRIYTSLMGCYVNNKVLLAQNYSFFWELAYCTTVQSCYTRWATREILCDRTYMEVSGFCPLYIFIQMFVLNILVSPSLGATDESGIWKMTFYTPEPVVMMKGEAEQAGYQAMTTAHRLVVRSPYSTAETYPEDVIMNMVAACPTGEVGPSFLQDRRQMAARGYALSATDFHIVVEIPVGSPDGYNKVNYQYHITYTVEPMLEVMWRAERSHEDTRYKILFPITTPLMPRPPQAVDFTNAEERLFGIHVGTFLDDVELKNITFSTGTSTLEECVAKGFIVQEHRHPGGLKSFSLKVPFVATEVLKHVCDLLGVSAIVTRVNETRFSSICRIPMTFGNQGKNFETLIEYKPLTPELEQEFRLQENETHLTLVVPFTAKQTAFEVEFRNITNDLELPLTFFFVFFPSPPLCYPNGTITALAAKVESVPNLIPGWLTLKDKSCKPFFSDDRFAYFSFGVDSCGTTRTIGHYYTNRGNTYASPNDPEYSYFYQAEDYPVVTYLRQPLYFEVALTRSNDPSLELILESCWATAYEDSSSQPSWDVIVNTYDFYLFFNSLSMVCDINDTSEDICRGQCPRRSPGISGFQGIKGLKSEP